MGTTDPLYALHLSNAMGSTPSFIHMQVTGNNTVGGGGGIAFDTSCTSSSSSNGLYLATIAGIRNSANDGSNDLVFSTSRSGYNNELPMEKMRIDSIGYVHIGDSTASAHADRLLQIGKTDRSATYLELRTSTSGVGGIVFSEGTAGDDSGYRGTIEYNQASDYMQFKTAGTEKMRLTSTGTLQVGVSGSGYTWTNIYSHGSIGIKSAEKIWTDTSSGWFRLQGGNTYPGGAIDVYGGSGNNKISMGLSGTSATTVEYFRIDGNGTYIHNNIYTPGYITLDSAADYTNPNLKLKSDLGRIEFWRTTNGSSPYNASFSIQANANDFFIADHDWGTYVWLDQDAASSWNGTSDARLKENVVDIPYGIDTIKAIKPRKFNFIGKPKMCLGFIAQELKPVLPEAVNGSGAAYSDDDTDIEKAAKTLGITRDSIIPVLVKALQESITKIETLETKVAALENS